MKNSTKIKLNCLECDKEFFVTQTYYYKKKIINYVYLEELNQEKNEDL